MRRRLGYASGTSGARDERVVAPRDVADAGERRLEHQRRPAGARARARARRRRRATRRGRRRARGRRPSGASSADRAARASRYVPCSLGPPAAAAVAAVVEQQDVEARPASSAACSTRSPTLPALPWHSSTWPSAGRRAPAPTSRAAARRPRSRSARSSNSRPACAGVARIWRSGKNSNELRTDVSGVPGIIAPAARLEPGRRAARSSGPGAERPRSLRTTR